MYKSESLVKYGLQMQIPDARYGHAYSQEYICGSVLKFPTAATERLENIYKVE